MENILLSLCTLMVAGIYLNGCAGLSAKHVIIHLSGVQELLKVDNNVSNTERDLILSMLEDIKKQIHVNNGTDVDVKDHSSAMYGQTPPSRIQDQVHSNGQMIGILKTAFREEKLRSKRDHRFIEHRLSNLESKSSTTELIAMLSTQDSLCKKYGQIEEILKQHLEDGIIEQSLQNKTHAMVSELSSSVNTLSKQFNSILNNTHCKVNSHHEDIKFPEAEVKSAGSDNTNYASCADIRDIKSGVYTVYPDFKPAGMQVFCDMGSDGGGWTVFQRRKDGFTDFYRGWNDYKKGFGDLEWEFWLGNDNLHMFTSARPTELRVDLVDVNGQRGFGKYALFKVDSESNGYRLFIKHFNGNIKDGLAYSNDMQFSTKDRDNDMRSGSCATLCNAAWWYNSCYRSNLNADYFGSEHTAITWHVWHGTFTPLRFSEMKLRWKY